MKKRMNATMVFAIVFVLMCATGARAEVGHMQIVVNATDLPRKLLHSQIRLDLKGKKTALLYPKWIPGAHGPIGPIKNIAGFEVVDHENKTLRWKRDLQDVYRFFVETEKIANPYTVSLRYICNQSTVNSQGVDSDGYPNMAVINWNTILVYPEGIPIRDITVELRLILPSGWQYATALPFDHAQGDTLVFAPVTLEELIDAPLICGKYVRTTKFASTKQAEYFLHTVAEDPKFFPKSDSSYVAFKRLAEEGEALFSRTHFNTYHFLLVLSDTQPGLGIEHRNSSLNSAKADAFKNAQKHDTRVQGLIPHEFVHAWCGKYRRPIGMNTPDYNAVKEMDMLWIYEGLTSYLGAVLSVRSGFTTLDELKGGWAYRWGRLGLQKGRVWRALQDTEAASYTLRGGSENWAFLRGGQDYYREGALIWLEIDSRIRSATKGKKSLDDFCAVFFGKGDIKIHAVSFDMDEVVNILTSLADEPWAELIEDRVRKTSPVFDPQGITQSGYRLGFTDKKDETRKEIETRSKWRAYLESVGLVVTQDGKVGDVVPESPADQIGLYTGLEIAGVSGLKFSFERFEDAIRATPNSGKVDLLILEGEAFRQMEIRYDGGLRYYTLEPVEGKQDWLKEILSQKVTESK
jgi:predicted metalloprotease with PDZ domain